jgi:YbbR domain-containing protein
VRRFIVELRRAVVQDGVYKLAALVVAVSAWAWVQGEATAEETVRARVGWVLPEGLLPSEAPVESARVTVRGTQAVIRALRQRELSISVDLARASAGNVAVDLADRPIVGLPDQARVTDVVPGNVRLHLERALRRRVAVKVMTRGKVADGYELKSLAAEPSHVELTGPASVVRQLTEVATDVIDIGDLREDGDFPVGLGGRLGVVRPTEAVTIRVRADVELITRERAFDAVAVEGLDGRFLAEPPVLTVVLVGPPSAVDAVDPASVHVAVSVPAEWSLPGGQASLDAGEGPRIAVVHGGEASVGVARVEPPTLQLRGADRAPRD